MVGDRRWLVAHLGPWKVREPIEVVAVVDEPDRQGFAYGTLTGHPLRGEEAFIVERLPDGSLLAHRPIGHATTDRKMGLRVSRGARGSTVLPPSLPTRPGRANQLSATLSECPG